MSEVTENAPTAKGEAAFLPRSRLNRTCALRTSEPELSAQSVRRN